VVNLSQSLADLVAGAKTLQNYCIGDLAGKIKEIVTPAA
jgi:hypothetical protein